MRRVAAAAVLLIPALITAQPAAHALTSCAPGCSVSAHEDDYRITYKATGVTLTEDAAQGVLANDAGPSTTKVDLPDTVDDYATNEHLVTTDQGFKVMINRDGSFTYTSDSSFSGIDSFAYYAWDAANHNDVDTNEVYITVVPIVRNDTYWLNGTTLNVAAPGVARNDVGIDPTTLTINGTSALGGNIVDNNNGAFTYTAPAGFSHGSDSFTYDVYDLNFDNDYTATVTITKDTTKPTVAMTAPHTLDSLSPDFAVTWHGIDNAGGSGISHYDVEQLSATWNGTASTWALWKTNTRATFATFVGTYGHSYCLRVHAVDKANNVSPWAQQCTSVPLKAASLRYSSGWHRATSATYFGGYAMATTARHAQAHLSGIHAKRLWLVVTQSKSAGTVQVLWNHTTVQTLNLASASTTHHKLLAALSFPSIRTGSLTLNVTTSGKYVTLEGLDVFSN
jgi:hypothetical protein